MRRAVLALAAGVLVILAGVGNGLAQPKFEFKLGFKALADQIPGVVGQALEEEHYGPNGDSLQQTSTGLMVWRKADNWTAFTNGSRTWINGPAGAQERGNEERFDWEAGAPAPAPSGPPAAAPSTSPGGDQIAFVGDPDASLWMANADGSGKTRVGDLTSVSCPTLSPDGKKVAFRVGISQQEGLYVANLDGTGRTRLSSGDRDAGASWTPDGKKLVFKGFLTSPMGSAIFAINADGTGRTLLSTNISHSVSVCEQLPRLSPDGKQIAFRTRPGDGIHVINIDGTGERRLVDSTSASDPNWSPDGQKIAFTMSVGDYSGGIYLMNPDGTGQRRVIEGHSPAWSPDGQKIAFIGRRDYQGGIFVANADGTGEVRVLRSENRERIRFSGFMHLSWSPDGHKIAFLAQPPREGWQLFVVNADGTTVDAPVLAAARAWFKPTWIPRP